VSADKADTEEGVISEHTSLNQYIVYVLTPGR
jgi:hypothetical protein